MNKNIKTAIIVGSIAVVIIVVLPLVFGAIPGWPCYGYGMTGPWMMGGFGGMWLMPVFWGLIIWAVVALVHGLGESRGSHSLKADSPLEMLKKRYARGEIDKQEYEEKKKDMV